MGPRWVPLCKNIKLIFFARKFLRNRPNKQLHALLPAADGSHGICGIQPPNRDFTETNFRELRSRTENLEPLAILRDTNFRELQYRIENLDQSIFFAGDCCLVN